MDGIRENGDDADDIVVGGTFGEVEPGITGVVCRIVNPYPTTTSPQHQAPSQHQASPQHHHSMRICTV